MRKLIDELSFLVESKGESIPKTMKEINDYFHKNGLDGYDLVKGRGYFYIWNSDDSSIGKYGDTSKWQSTSIYVNALWHMTFEKWLSYALLVAKEGKESIW